MADNKKDVGPEGAVHHKNINAIPDPNDDVEGHRAGGKHTWGGGPEGSIHHKNINAIPEGEDEDVEGHSYSKKNTV